MTTALTRATKNGTGLSATVWDAEQIRLLKEVLTENLTDNEFALFGQICHRTGLDPFAKQIYAIKRKSNKKVGNQWVEDWKMTIQTGIDGYRVIAERTGEYVGGDAPEYGPECRCPMSRQHPHPEWASVTVRRLKRGQLFDTSERADFDEYVPTTGSGAERKPNAMWAKMPKRMIAKCAEALALRRAFPGHFDGVYTSEEMDQVDNTAPATTPPANTQAQPAAAAPTVVDNTTIEATARDVTPAAPERPAMAAGERPFAIGDPCPLCAEVGVTAAFALAKAGPRRGELQCKGKAPDGSWYNHLAPAAVNDPETDLPVPVGGEVDQTPIPF